ALRSAYFFSTSGLRERSWSRSMFASCTVLTPPAYGAQRILWQIPFLILTSAQDTGLFRTGERPSAEGIRSAPRQQKESPGSELPGVSQQRRMRDLNPRGA